MRAINPGAEAASQASKRPLEDVKGDKGEITPRDEVQPYKSFWAKFKRPSTPDVSVAPTPEKSGTDVGGAEVNLTPPPTTGAASASVPAPVTTDVVRKPEEAASPVEVPAATPKRKPEVEVVEASPTPAKEVPDNQLGDSALYPPTPVTTSPTSGPVEADAKDVTANGVHKAGGEKPTGEGESEKLQSLPEFSSDGSSEELMKEMDKMFGPDNQTETTKKFTPQAEDVRACLQRKTTVDLAPPIQVGHTRVLLSLAGVLQPVWVPMTADAAKAAGFQLADDATGVPIGEPPVMGLEPKPTTTPAETKPTPTAAAETNENNTKPDEVPPPGATAEAGKDVAQEAADAAKAAVKNGYMRFFRSVSSPYAALRGGKNKGTVWGIDNT